jgi:hypothetical protein
LSEVLQQRVEDDVDFGLAGGGDLVVLALDRDSERDHRQDHLVADVDQLVGRGDGEVALLVADLVAEVWEPLSPPSPCRCSRCPRSSRPCRGRFDGVIATSSKMKNSASGPKYAVSARPVLLR